MIRVCWNRLRGEEGQSFLESSLGLLVICFMAAATINAYYFIAYAQTVISASYQGALAAGLGYPADATATAQSIIANTTVNPKAPGATISVCAFALGTSGSLANCSDGGNPGFVDPEAGSNGTTTGQFFASSTTTSESFQAFMKGSILGRNIIPFLPSKPFTRTFYIRSFVPIPLVTEGDIN